ncbi:MAG: response regulator [Proteobacteria bacterium]|nr:response regulator [Pseudomonadota bacterium]
MNPPLTVFLVEDNSHVRLSLIPALQDLLGAQILATAESESEALAWLAAHKEGWDLAVVELFLKQGTGLGVVRWTHERLERQKVAVLTDYPTEATRSWCQKAGADAVFDKETELDQFIAFCQGLSGSPAAGLG